MPLKDFRKLIGVRIFLESRRKRSFVGILTKKEGKFHFEYDRSYLNARNAIPLGPEMPLTRAIYDSEALFVPFLDRIPSRENPAYPEYCQAMGISVDEKDPFLLLTTIAHRGPSSFIFEPFYEEIFSFEDLIKFRKSLGLSTKEFALCFDCSFAAIHRIEKKRSSGRDLLKRLEIYVSYPKVALDQIRLQRGVLHIDQFKRLETHFQKLLKSIGQ